MEDFGIKKQSMARRGDAMKLSELCNGNYFYYEIEYGGKGIVAADSPEEAELKVRSAYKKHGELSDLTEIRIYDSFSWFKDATDVIEISEW